MKKKKEQVKSLQKSFELMLKTFKQVDKKNRKDAYGFIMTCLTEITEYLNGEGEPIISTERMHNVPSEPIVAEVKPSQAMFEKSVSGNQNSQD